MQFRKTKVPTPEQKEEMETKDFFDMILPGTIKFYPDQYIVGDSYRCVWVMREYPPSTDKQAILFRLADRNDVTLRIYNRLVEGMEQKKIVQNATRKNKLKSGGSYQHYDNSRYHALNLHSVFSKGTIEFRLFNSALHAGKVKSYIQLCLAISRQALVQKGASRTKTQSPNEKYTFRTWLLGLGLIGNEFKTARQHLLKNLDGNIAWRDPTQAEAQKERLAAKRLAEQQTEEQETPQNDMEEVTEQEQIAPAFSRTM